MEPERIKTDVLVLGAGLAGLEAAWAARQAGVKVLVLNKGASASCAVLGFNAPVGREDSQVRFAEDTFQGGWELGNLELVRELAEKSAQTVVHMEALGQTFERTPGSAGEYQLLQPLGCSVPRLVHSGNTTGKRSMEILMARLQADGVKMMEHVMAVTLIKEQAAVCGAIAVSTESDDVYCITARAVVLATGGAHMMKNSTYPLCQTADGFAMAYHAGARLIDLEFIQHEPCRAVWPKPLGISTTLLQKGGVLTNAKGERFVQAHYASEGKIPKDMLARLIALEIAQGRGTPHGGVYLDLTGIPEDEIKVNHKLYYSRFMAAGIDITKEIIEVSPAAHSMMGGVCIDAQGYTGVPGLYAAGEVIGGLHGANRLGGNAGAETYVFGRNAGTAAALCETWSEPNEQALRNATECLHHNASDESIDYERYREQTLTIVAAAMGPVRTAEYMRQASAQLDEALVFLNNSIPNSLANARAKVEAIHLTETAALVCKAALCREESRGVHIRADFPERDDIHWKRHIQFQLQTGMTY